ncbi:HNH endonuclease signature motif containing protein [Agromyces agglutinans]|nr:HNH endonuclease signature motif containing protein [Agromyces agglutinans]
MEQLPTPTPRASLAGLAALERDVAVLGEQWVGAMPAWGATAGSAQVEVEQMSDPGLMRVVDALARVRRDADAMLARVAAEVAKRSGPEFGDLGFAKAQGFHNPTRLLAASTGASRADASRLIAVGTATAQRQTFSGERLPSRHPHVAAAVEAATIGLEAASAIVSMLERASARAEVGHVDVVEAALVDLAGRVPLETLMRGIREAEARLDPDGVEPREDLLRMERSLTMREDGRGMVHLHARLDPESAAPVKSAIEALVSDALRRREPGAGDSAAGGPAAGGLGASGLGAGGLGASGLGADALAAIADDRRSIPQIQADALAALARHTLGCAETLTPLAKTTVIVRVDLDTLVTGLGPARIDGLDEPISAATARRMAADAEIIPAVFGGDSIPLDLGRAARLFTKAQRLALGERDGGCAACGQNIGYVEAHHISWWERDTGPTDLSNGVLLCGFCHHTVHREGWSIHASPSEVWFIPPPHVDPAQVPRLGGRARFALREARAA